MGAFSPTASQKSAIETLGSAVLVSAGAGSGKTKVLTERLLHRLRDTEHPADLDSFLIITFTRAAAAELRGRIMEELGAALAADPENRRLRRQSALCRRAQIGTIHSFCAALLRENSQKAGISPDFSILDDDRARLMMASALERVLERRYEHEDADFRLLADTVGAGRDDRELGALCLSLYRRMQCQARPERWAGEQIALLERPVDDIGETRWGRELMESFRQTAAYWAEVMDRGLGEMRREPRILAAYGDGYAETADLLRDFCRRLDLGWEEARELLPFRFPGLKSLRSSPDPALSERLKAQKTACKKAMDAVAEGMGRSSTALLEDLRQTAPSMKALLHLVLDFKKEYGSAKRRAGVLDYADLEHLSAQLLTLEDGSPSPLAAEIAGRYSEIMVDEYQDVSLVQDVIFHALSRGGRNLFLVGDVKQSIYRFRLADPEIFNEKYRSYADDERAEPGEPRRILLRENFRSRREIIDAANAVFSNCMSRRLGDVDYDEAAALRFGAAYGPGELPKPELLLLDTGTDGGEEGDSPDQRAAEAALVAEKIRELLEQGVTVQTKEGPRALRCGDIAVLLRNANQVSGVYRRELSRRGIPVAAGQGGNYYSSVEVSTVCSMLALLDDPHQDIPLIAVLRSPAVGFEADELSEMRACSGDADLYTALTLYAGRSQKASRFLRLLLKLREEAPDLRAAELVERLLDELDLPALCSAMSDGEQRRARLLALIDLAEGFERSGYRGLHRFVLWLRQLASREQEPALGGGSASAVQILSIHKSKGLEFPVVFVCDTAHRFNTQDSRARVLVHPELGLGPKLTDLKRRVELPTLARTAIAQRLKRETLSEEMRLLYVALTRAKERLFVTAALKSPEKTVDKLRPAVSSPFSPEILRQQNSMAAWMICAVLADGERHWSLRIVQSEAQRESESAETAQVEPDEAFAEELRRRLAFRYPHALAQELPSKLTATELKGRLEPDPEAEPLSASRRSFRTPDLSDGERRLSAAERGTATHLVLQVMDFSRTGSLEEIEGEIERLRQQRTLSEREARAVDARSILRLFESPIGQRMRSADSIRREFHFSLLSPAEHYFPGGEGEEILLQGVVDCFIEERGALTVIDYKTDRVRSREEAEQRARHYVPQLRAYAEALRRITGKPVVQTLLFFLAIGETVELV